MIDYIGKLTARSLDDFEISVFLTETTTRHSLLTKHKHFHDTAQTKLTSNNPAGHSLVHAASEAPIDVDVDNDDDPALTAILRREESDDYDDIEVKGYILRNPWFTDGCACILC